MQFRKVDNFLFHFRIKPLSANRTKWSNTLREFVGNLPTSCLSVFDYFVGLALKGLKYLKRKFKTAILKSSHPQVFCEKRCSKIFRKIYRKIPVPETLFNKVAGLGLQLY